MATQETTLGHLGKVRGMGDDGHHPLAPEERRGDAEETPRRRKRRRRCPNRKWTEITRMAP